MFEALELEQKLEEAARALMAASLVAFKPRFPWVFVRVLKKEMTTAAGLVMVEGANKPVHEGIVLSTWAPMHLAVEMSPGSRPNEYTPKIVGKGSTCPDCKGIASTDFCSACAGQGVVFSTGLGRTYVCGVKVGAHVLFPHWAGLPISGFSEDYRIVKEEGWSTTTEGGIFATVEHEDRGLEPCNVLADILAKHAEQWGTKFDVDTVGSFVADVRARFELVDKQTRSVTLSGR